MHLDAFLDLENLGITFGIQHSKEKLDFIAERLPAALAKEGFELSSAFCFASDARSKVRLPHKIKRAMREAAQRHHWTMIWSHSIADTALIDAVGSRLDKGTLAPAALFISNDHHFAPIMRRVNESGRKTIVCYTDAGERLKAVADRSFGLWDLLGENPGEVRWDKLEEHRQRMPGINRIKLPDGL